MLNFNCNLSSLFIIYNSMFDSTDTVIKVISGFSDHTINSTSAVVAVALGAKVIEKHITLDKKMKGPDHFYASEPGEFTQYVKDIRNAEASLGSGNIEMNSKVRAIARRESIYAKTDIEKRRQNGPQKGPHGWSEPHSVRTVHTEGSEGPQVGPKMDPSWS